MSAKDETVRLIRHLYVDLDQIMGGPLHVILDDGNVEDWVLDDKPYRYAYLFNGQFEEWAQAGDDVSDERKSAIRDTCEAILALLRPMSEAERKTTLGEFWKARRP